MPEEELGGIKDKVDWVLDNECMLIEKRRFEYSPSSAHSNGMVDDLPVVAPVDAINVDPGVVV